MVKIYYDAATGILCDRVRTDIKQNENSPFIEVDEETELKTYCVDYGKTWAVKDGQLVIIDDEVVQATPTYQRMVLNNQIAEYKYILSSTDYIIPKIQEASILGDDVEALKTQYATQLEQRKNARARINELEAQLKALGE